MQKVQTEDAKNKKVWSPKKRKVCYLLVYSFHKWYFYTMKLQDQYVT